MRLLLSCLSLVLFASSAFAAKDYYETYACPSPGKIFKLQRTGDGMVFFDMQEGVRSTIRWFADPRSEGKSSEASCVNRSVKEKKDGAEYWTPPALTEVRLNTKSLFPNQYMMQCVYEEVPMQGGGTCTMIVTPSSGVINRDLVTENNCFFGPQHKPVSPNDFDGTCQGNNLVCSLTCGSK